MNKIKDLARLYYIKLFHYIKIRVDFIINYVIDYKLYKKHSIVFHKTSLKNKEADLILNYHSLEKGMLFKDMKKGFATNRINNLHKVLKDPEIINNISRSQIKVGYQIMCQYYELHQEKGYDIEEFFNHEQYRFYKLVIDSNDQTCFNGIINWTKEGFFKENNKEFKKFAHSRKSVREFTGRKFTHDILSKVIELANTAPSVCNRQASNVYLLEDKTKIDKTLKIQGGFTGYSENVSQLLILTNDRKYYYTIGERNQLYIDGGVYLMNLLYALHYYEIGNCPANWGKTYKDEEKLSEIIDLPESEKIICFIPIGDLKNNFRTTLSQRRVISENFIKL
ncbi:nitroreductase family protein [Gelidibacter pelagius]|uniref:Nitroreductase family protein n=1 Tax=Gelidibacter pelagius TaxID=2819985 RepID=A0ABS3SWU5_9FLAO|nr:nitroreductase family protein [Gelidibacter pelagius]MBO3100184.1 nitroreductase family protein [Gelidibacter pelagius]